METIYDILAQYPLWLHFFALFVGGGVRVMTKRTLTPIIPHWGSLPSSQPSRRTVLSQLPRL